MQRSCLHEGSNDAAIERSEELASLHNIKSVAYKVDGKRILPILSAIYTHSLLASLRFHTGFPNHEKGC